MPKGGNFGLSVLIAGLPIPRYHHKGKVSMGNNCNTCQLQSVRERNGIWKVNTLDIGSKVTKYPTILLS